MLKSNILLKSLYFTKKISFLGLAVNIFLGVYTDPYWRCCNSKIFYLSLNLILFQLILVQKYDIFWAFYI